MVIQKTANEKEELTEEEIGQLEEAGKQPIFYDVDSPAMTPEMEKGFRLAAMARNRRKNKKKVMVLSIIHPYDSVEVLGVFDDVEILRQECHKVIKRDTYLQQDISNLHIYECTMNHMFAEFYPFDYDKPDDEGCYLEKQEDICSEILGDDFIRELRMKQRKEKHK